MTPPAVPMPTPDTPPRLCVLIDVEEEFDWSQGFDAAERGVSHLRRLPELLELLSARGLAPVGVCSYPVVEDPAALEILGAELEAGRLVLGTHLHPWVCPPASEVNDHCSFPGNLPIELERAKLTTLTEALEAALGTRPKIYQAGRYGLGPHTYELLDELGYAVDMSISPGFDYRAEGGPDFRRASRGPTWVGPRHALLSVPVTGGFVGALAGLGPILHPLASSSALSSLKLQAVLSRSGMLERLRLSPEGHDVEDMLRLTRYLLSRGERAFCMSLHSPSLEPGHTSYVRDEAERGDFVSRITRFVDVFVEQLGGQLVTPLELHAELAATARPEGAARP